MTSSIGELQSAARAMIEPHVPSVSLRKRRYNTDDIISVVQEVIDTDHDDTSEFSRMFPANMAGLRSLYDFVLHTFTYVEDPSANQWIQTPSFLMYTKRGDCKSYTVFISSILRNMGIRHKIRYVSYGGNKYTHVYPVAIINAREIPMDVVWKKQDGGPFGREKQYTKKKDYIVEGLYKLGNTQLNGIGSSVEELKRTMADVPDSIVDAGPGDVTKMSVGQLDKFLWEDRFLIWADKEANPHKRAQYKDAALALQQGSLSGIGSLRADPLGIQVQQILTRSVTNNQPAFKPFTIEIPNPAISGFFKDVGKFFKKVVDTVGDLFKKFVNWIFKTAGKAMAPYFIFMFLKKTLIKSKEVKRRREAQEKSFDFIVKKGKLDQGQLMGVVINGIKEQTGKSPQEIITEAGAGHLAGLPALIPIVIKAIGFVVQVITKIVGIFKNNKSEAGDINQGNMSDPTLLEEERPQETTTGGNGGGQESSGGGSGGGGLGAGLGLLAALGLMAFR